MCESEDDGMIIEKKTFLCMVIEKNGWKKRSKTTAQLRKDWFL